jgi:hypothetical protein
MPAEAHKRLHDLAIKGLDGVHADGLSGTLVTSEAVPKLTVTV